MKKAILFDLDGTLLPMNFDRFMNVYFEKMSGYFADLLNPATLPKSILMGTQTMVADTSELTNETIFMTFFSEYYKDDISKYKGRFETFYKTIFDDVRISTWQSNEMKEVVSYLKTKNIPMVIATNPLFPMEANLRRIKWAGLDPNDFVYITSLEANTKCKPNPKFFKEVLDQTGYEPADVLMVGNDYLEDGVAITLGIDTYIITDCALNDQLTGYKPTYESNYQDFLSFIKNNY
jgi:FMN phosphatase YigB (HAD superfamily)